MSFRVDSKIKLERFSFCIGKLKRICVYCVLLRHKSLERFFGWLQKFGENYPELSKLAAKLGVKRVVGTAGTGYGAWELFKHIMLPKLIGDNKSVTRTYDPKNGLQAV